MPNDDQTISCAGGRTSRATPCFVLSSGFRNPYLYRIIINILTLRGSRRTCDNYKTNRRQTVAENRGNSAQGARLKSSPPWGRGVGCLTAGRKYTPNLLAQTACCGARKELHNGKVGWSLLMRGNFCGGAPFSSNVSHMRIAESNDTGTAWGVSAPWDSSRCCWVVHG